MYRFSAADFGVYIDGTKTPSRGQWQEVMNAKKLPLIFPEEFDPHKHPVCERTQVNHPNGEVATRIGAATCRYQLDIYDDLALEDFRIESQRVALRQCDTSFTFRDEPRNAAISLAVYLSAATLALVADGVIIWGRSMDETRSGAEAYKVLVAKAWRNARYRAPGNPLSKQDPFGPPLAPVLNSDQPDEPSCPRCGYPIQFDNDYAFDGEKHISCGQLINAPSLDS